MAHNFKLDEAYIRQFVAEALREDVGDGDITSLACISADSRDKAVLKVKDDGVLAGVTLAKYIFQYVDPTSEIKVLIEDGSSVSFGDIAFEVTCNTRALLQAERLVLNCMQRMSGIATLSNRYLFEIEDLPVKILDTRKTTPLFRYFEKWAVHLGGCMNYRDGLYDWFMIKDNHIEACGGIPKAIEQVDAYKKANHMEHFGVTVEVRNLVEVYEAIDTGKITRIMFDNFELPLLLEGVAIVAKRFETEASGGVNIHTIRKIAQSGVDYISVGALTHAAQSLDLSLKVV